MTWETVDRPGQQGFKKEEKYELWNGTYGKGNWRLVHVLEGRVLLKPDVFFVCEEAYYRHSLEHSELWQKLLAEAKDIYDFSLEELQSGLDYTKQLHYTRFHDICIRRVVARHDWRFGGERIVQIRFEKDKPDFFSQVFDPGKIRFHLPDLILKPNITGWWDVDSIEDFYQSNKVLQVNRE